MPRKRKIAAESGTIVDFEYQDRTYQIDPQLKKVYRSFVEIETSKAAVIFSDWRTSSVTV